MADDTTRQLVVFSLAGEEYALPIGAISEIIRFTKPRAVASGEPGLCGVIGLRGKIIPVFDLAARLGLPAGESAEGKIVIVETATARVGVVVDEVDEVLTVSAEQLEDLPASGSEAIETIAKIGERLVVLLDPRPLVGSALAA
jgi:purine-binding chemotaxis protein CheW